MGWTKMLIKKRLLQVCLICRDISAAKCMITDVCLGLRHMGAGISCTVFCPESNNIVYVRYPVQSVSVISGQFLTDKFRYTKTVI